MALNVILLNQRNGEITWLLERLWILLVFICSLLEMERRLEII